MSLRQVKVSNPINNQHRSMSFKLPTYTWGTERETCRKCQHYRPKDEITKRHGASLLMLCTTNPYKGIRGIGTCIDNRTRGPCGRDARLFAPIEDHRPVSDVAVHESAPERSGPVVQSQPV